MSHTEDLIQSDLNEDWKELFEAVKIAVLVVGREKLRIKRFNKTAREIFSQQLEPKKIITEVDHELVYDGLSSDIRQIFEDYITIKKNISTQYGKWYLTRIDAYQSSDETISDAVVSFVDVTDLKVELKNKIDVEKRLQREILEVEEKERWRLGQYLHDSTAQNLMTIKMLMDLIEPQLQELDDEARTELKKIKRLVIKSEKHIRELSHFVLPIEIEGKISEAFQELANQTAEIYDIDCDFTSEGAIDKIKDPAFASSVYYISQEAIRNAIHHGQAERVEVSLSTDNESLFLTIKDDGIGYDKNKKESGMGINIMKHRAELLGGSLGIKASTKDRGTIVKCTIPLERANQT